MVHSMVLRSSAAHQPSSRRRIVSPPHSSTAMKTAGTPVSVISNTSRRQQHAAQVLQVTLAGASDLSGMFMAPL
jgi:hypothetical protein